MSAQAKTGALEGARRGARESCHLPTARRVFGHSPPRPRASSRHRLPTWRRCSRRRWAERAERRERRRLLDARFPLMKRLEEFRFDDNPSVPQATIAALAEGSWIDDRESVVLIGESGTGKSHLATALAICACQQGRRVRFTTPAALANELQEAESRRELARVVGRYGRIELLVLDELGYLALPEGGGRARLPDHLRAQRAGLIDRDHQPALRRVGEGLS